MENYLFARLYPAKGDALATIAITTSSNQARYNPPEVLPSIETDNWKEFVEGLSDNSSELISNGFSSENGVSSVSPGDRLETLPNLGFGFNQRPRNASGFVIGTDVTQCDVILPEGNNISRRHCCLGFDARRRLVLRDFSTNGTTVTYGEDGAYKRRNFIWLLSSDDLKPLDSKITIQIGKLSFWLTIPQPHVDHDSLLRMIDSFLIQAKNGLPNEHYETLQTPDLLDPRTICIQHNLIKEGVSSRLRQIWNVSTGAILAIKNFKFPLETDWRTEVRITKEASLLSDHIIRYVGYFESPPCLILEHLPLGTLLSQNTHTPFMPSEVMAILQQGLSALAALHASGIVHQDLTPENILVGCRYPLDIKLCDFGASYIEGDLQIFSGNETYSAPEIFLPLFAKYRAQYPTACDIWSLGLVVMEFKLGLPNFEEDFDMGDWFRAIGVRMGGKSQDLLLEFVRTSMLQMSAAKRLPASQLSGIWNETQKLWDPFN